VSTTGTVGSLFAAKPSTPALVLLVGSIEF